MRLEWALEGAPPEAVASRYTCLHPLQVRRGFALDSQKAGALKQGAVIEVLEARRNDEGVLRIGF